MTTALRDEALKLLDGRGAILDAAREISAALREAGVEGAIVGGIAVVLHGHVRTTIDVDIDSAEPAERLVRILVLSGSRSTDPAVTSRERTSSSTSAPRSRSQGLPAS